ncbi:MAG TPA: PAS domain S-box protein [Pyrinomonadaceae bacterium]|nr:PAS domain S-box protein [Pyrinomonadaceae bacterium]
MSVENQRARASVRESEDHYRAVAEAATDAIITIDSNSTILNVNPATERIFGYSTEEMIGQSLTMLMPEYLRHLHQAGITRYLQTGQKHIQWSAAQLPGLHKTGNEIPLEISFAEFTRDGRHFFTGIARDISERKRLQERQARLARHAILHAEVSASVSESEKPLGEMLQICAAAVVQRLDAAFARIWLLNYEQKVLELKASAGLYTHLNGAHARIPLGSFKIGLIAAKQKPHLTNSVETDERVSDKEWARREGMTSFAGYPLLVEGRTVGVIAMFARQSLEQDTIEALESVAPIVAQGVERKRTQHALLETQRLIQAIFDNSSVVIHVKDLDGHYVLVNRKFEEVVGLPWQQIIGKTVSDLFPSNTTAHNIDRQVIETGATSESEEVLTTERGNRVFLTTKTLLSDESGKPYALFGISADITERKKAEADLREMQAELAHMNRLMTVGELTASIAHELNQPLAAIAWNANAALRWLALDPPNLVKARDSAELIIRDDDRAGQVIARIRALLKKAPPSKTLLDVNELVNEVLDLSQNEIVQHDVRLRVGLADDLPKLPGDRIQLQQVMLNLIVNAIEAMLTVENRRRALLITTGSFNDDAVRIAVSDNGPGIDSKVSDHLFNAFSTTKPEGMGMGLAISRSIIEAHGGRLWAEANDEFGATFQFTLPIVAD